MKNEYCASAIAIIILSLVGLGAQQGSTPPDLSVMDGVTPWGLTIPEEIKVIKKGSCIFSILYNGKESDELMGKYLQRLVDDMVRRIGQRSDCPSSRQIRISISNCRFGTIGYCKRMARKDIRVTIFEDNTMLNTVSFKTGDVFNRERCSELVEQIISAIPVQ